MLDSPVNLAPVADAQNQDERDPIVDVGDQAVIANPIFPETAQFRALERFADASRVLRRGDALMQKAQDALGGGAIETAQVLLRQGR